MSDTSREDEVQRDEDTTARVVEGGDAPAAAEGEENADAKRVGQRASKSRSTKKERLRVELAESEGRVRRLRRSALVLAGALVLVLVAATGGGIWLTKSRSDAVARADAARATTADLAVVRKVAEDYTKKALTIDFNRAPDYVKSLADGTTQTFGETFAMNEKGAGPLIVELQQQLRMVATGDVVHSLYDGDLASPPSAGQPWNVIVIANQTSTTAQQPDKSTQVMVLRVVVVKLDGQWKIANFGPDPKSMGAATAIPGVK